MDVSLDFWVTTLVNGDSGQSLYWSPTLRCFCLASIDNLGGFVAFLTAFFGGAPATSPALTRAVRNDASFLTWPAVFCGAAFFAVRFAAAVALAVFDAVADAVWWALLPDAGL